MPDLTALFDKARTAAKTAVDDLQAAVAAALADQPGDGGNGGHGGGTPATGRPFFTAADWLWNPIPANPRLADQSSAWAALLAQGKHVALEEAYATLWFEYGPSDNPRRATVSLSSPYGGPARLANVPYPQTRPQEASGDDDAVAIIDRAQGVVISMWGAKWSANGWSARAGSVKAIDSDGIENLQRDGTSTGANLARAACVVTLAEIKAGLVPHALFFSTDIAKPGEFWSPAAKTDASNMAKVGNPIPEGARVQLDPSIDLSKIPGITWFELAIGRGLQTHGAYCGDNGGSRMSISCQWAKYDEWDQQPGDWNGFPHLPWNRLRVLAKPGA